MNKIFKVIWNRTTQSLVVTSELAKGQVKSSSDASAPTVSSQVGKLFKLSAVALATLGVAGQVNAAVTAPLNNIAVIFFFTIFHPPYFSFILYIIFLLYIILFLFLL